MGVSVDESPQGLPPDFFAALEGGENFLKRLGAIQQAKKEHDAALDALGIGRNVVAAKAEIEQKHALANKAIADAQQKAQQMAVAATAQAKQIVDAAHTRAGELTAQAEAYKARANQVLDEASKTMDRANATKVQAEQDAVAAAALKQDHAKAKAEAESAAKAHQEAAAAYKTKLDQFSAFIKAQQG